MEADYRAAEYPLSYSHEEDGKRVQESGSINLLYCKDGVWIVVDYKTNKLGSEEDRARLESACAGQLGGYVNVLTALDREVGTLVRGPGAGPV